MELASRAGLHLNTVNLVEAGKKSVQIETVFKLAQGLGCTLGELFDGIDNVT